MICYLCGKSIEGARSRDHAVPASLIQRSQPKVKGYDYAGALPTHPECNNRFGPETYAVRAIEFLAALGQPDFLLERQHVAAPDIKIMAINAGLLPNFTEADLRFFKMIDVRDVDQGAWSSPEFFRDKERTNPIRQAVFVSLSVLAKSAAALLCKRHGVAPSSYWRIHAFAYTGAPPSLSFDDAFGPTKPFDDDLQPWIHEMGGGNYFIAYKARGTLIFFLFALIDNQAVPGVRALLRDADHLFFQGSAINDLLTTGWKTLS